MRKARVNDIPTMNAIENRIQGNLNPFLSWFSGLFIHNALFHVWGTAFFRDLSPGLISCVILYLPLTFLVLKAILRQGLLSRFAFVAAFVIGGLAHYAFIWVDL